MSTSETTKLLQTINKKTHYHNLHWDDRPSPSQLGVYCSWEDGDDFCPFYLDREGILNLIQDKFYPDDDPY
jgi:hypothetical protein